MPRRSAPIRRQQQPVMSMWTVYDHPTDYPRHFVARRFVVLGGGLFGPTDDARFATTLSELRTMLPRGLYRLDRMPDDDPKVLEVWL